MSNINLIIEERAKMEFIGNLDDTQKGRLLATANACTLHKILSNPIDIFSYVVE